MNLKSLARTLVLLNGLDALATLGTVQVLGAEELNPIWGIVLQWPILFVLVKYFSVALWAKWLADGGQRIALILLCCVYTAVLGAHFAVFISAIRLNP